ncbi:NAD(P)-binding protein [Sparassis latifolia]
MPILANILAKFGGDMHRYVVQVLAVVGAVVVTKGIYQLVSFTWFYFLRPCSVQKYMHGPSPYVLITGGSDGIGKAIAQDLYDRGFNVIIHGRNEEKTRGVADAIRARRMGDVQYFIADATRPGHDFAHMVEPFRHLNITLVVHNVGGDSMRREKVDELPESHHLSVIQLNAIFPLLLTRALLPALRIAAARGPTMVQFMGSVASDIPPPRQVVYAASKAFLSTLCRGLDSDERAWGQPSGVHFSYLVVNAVISGGLHGQVSLTTPSAAYFGKAVVSQIGCGRRRYAPYAVHAAMQWALGFTREEMVDAIMAQAVDELLVAQEKEA